MELDVESEESELCGDRFMNGKKRCITREGVNPGRRQNKIIAIG